MEQPICAQNLGENGSLSQGNILSGNILNFSWTHPRESCTAIREHEALSRRAGWLSRPTLNTRYVDPSVCRSSVCLPEILAEEKRLRRLYGGKGLGILYLESRAAELGYSVPCFELIPTSVFDDFMDLNGIRREEFLPVPEPEEPEKKDWKSAAKSELESSSRELSGGEIKEIYRKHRLEFLAENKRFKNKCRKTNRKNSFQNTLNRFMEGSFTPESEAVLREAFESLRSEMRGALRPLVLSSSSVMEDDLQHPFKGIYESHFLSMTEDSERDFEAFKDAVKYIFAHVFSPRARSYREAHGLPDEDRMAIVAKHMVGAGSFYHFRPEISGVSYQNPYIPEVFFHDMNPGLNTKTVAGEWFYRFSSRKDSHGNVSLSGTRRTLEVLRNFSLHQYNPRGRRVEEERADFFELPGVPDVEVHASGMDAIYRALTEERGLMELEWSVGEYGELVPYQCRLMPPVSEVLSRISLDVPRENIVLEGVPVLGHGEITLPVLAYPDFQSVSMAMDFFARDAGLPGYIIIGNSQVLENEVFGTNPSGNSLDGILPGLRGFIDTNKDSMPLSAHWSEPFISKNILVISTSELDPASRAFIERLAASVSPHEVQERILMTPPLRMAVDVAGGRGIVHVTG